MINFVGSFHGNWAGLEFIYKYKTRFPLLFLIVVFNLPFKNIIFLGTTCGIRDITKSLSISTSIQLDIHLIMFLVNFSLASEARCC